MIILAILGIFLVIAAIMADAELKDILNDTLFILGCMVLTLSAIAGITIAIGWSVGA